MPQYVQNRVTFVQRVSFVAQEPRVRGPGLRSWVGSPVLAFDVKCPGWESGFFSSMPLNRVLDLNITDVVSTSVNLLLIDLFKILLKILIFKILSIQHWASSLTQNKDRTSEITDTIYPYNCLLKSDNYSTEKTND